MDFFQPLPETVHSSTVDFLPEEGLRSLFVASGTMRDYVNKAKTSDYYWLGRIASFLGVERDSVVLPVGIDLEKLYNDFLVIGYDPILVKWLSGATLSEDDTNKLVMHASKKTIGYTGGFLLLPKAEANYKAWLPRLLSTGLSRRR